MNKLLKWHKEVIKILPLAPNEIRMFNSKIIIFIYTVGNKSCSLAFTKETLKWDIHAFKNWFNWKIQDLYD